MPERLDGGRALLALGALALLVSLFLDWFKPGLTAWTVFEIVDLLLAATAVAALLAVVTQALPGSGGRTPPPAAAPVLAAIALVLVVATLLNHPPAAVGRSLDTGAWIALAGAVLMALGALLGFGRVSLVITRRSDTQRGAASMSPEPPAAGEPTRPLGFEEVPGAETETRTLPRRER